MTTPTTHPRRWRVGLPLVALVAAGGLAWLLSPSEEGPTAPDIPALADAAAPAPAPAADPGARGAEDPDEDAAPDEVSAELRSTGRTDPVVDTEAQDARDAQAYRDRIDDNIAHLEMAAEVARQQGHPQRAELMEKRIKGLTRRLAEHEAEQAQDAAVPG